MLFFDSAVPVEPLILSRAVSRLVEVLLGELTEEQALAIFTAVSGGRSSLNMLDVGHDCGGIDHVIFAKAVKNLEKFSATSTDLTSTQTQALLGDGLQGSLLKQLDLFRADVGGVSPSAFSEAVNKLEVFTVENPLSLITSEHVEKLFQVMENATALKILDVQGDTHT